MAQSIGELQRQVDDVLRAGVAAAEAPLAPLAEEPGARPFSGFRLPDVQRAKALASAWMGMAEEVRGASGNGGGMADAVGEVLGAAGRAVAEMDSAPDEDAALGRHAVKLFLTHYRHGLPLRIRGLEARAPQLILPSNGGSAEAEGANPEEALLWWREDPKLNEHHEHWHVVYPISGVPAPGDPRGGATKDRQGELFLYMHRQMLARYDTERIAAGLERVAPWDYHDTEPWGYDPGPYLRPIYGPRPPGRQWQTTPEGAPGEPGALEVTVQD